MECNGIGIHGVEDDFEEDGLISVVGYSVWKRIFVPAQSNPLQSAYTACTEPVEVSPISIGIQVLSRCTVSDPGSAVVSCIG
jgi:hypothetical protein